MALKLVIQDDGRNVLEYDFGQFLHDFIEQLSFLKSVSFTKERRYRYFYKVAEGLIFKFKSKTRALR